MNKEVFIKMIVRDAYTVVGDRNETITQVIGDIGKFAHIAMSRAIGKTDINPYRRNTAFAAAEESEEDRKKTSDKFFEMAGRKILFLNAVCKKELGHGYFVDTKVNKESLEELKELVEAYCYMLSSLNRE